MEKPDLRANSEDFVSVAVSASVCPCDSC